MDDLYSGKLIADVAFDPQQHMDRNKRFKPLEDLLKELDADEKKITETATESVEGESSVPESSRETRQAQDEVVEADAVTKEDEISLEDEISAEALLDELSNQDEDSADHHGEHDEH